MRILVTGAGGFLGGILAQGLHQAGVSEVIGLSRTLSQDIPSTGVVWVNCDLSREIPLVDEVDYIVHCAALKPLPGMPVNEFIDISLTMMKNLLIYAKRVRAKGIVFTSSIDLHGEVRSDLLDEVTDRINPSIYGVSKYLGELMLRDCQASVSSVSLRLCGVIGPGATNCWIATVLAKALKGEAVGIVNEDRLFNNVVHTDDLVKFLLVLFSKGFSGFNAFPIASKSPVTIRGAVTEIIKSSGSASKIVNNGLSANSFMISNSFATRHFHYEPSTVVDNLRKYAREMSRLRCCSGMEQ